MGLDKVYADLQAAVAEAVAAMTEQRGRGYASDKESWASPWCGSPGGGSGWACCGPAPPRRGARTQRKSRRRPAAYRRNRA